MIPSPCLEELVALGLAAGPAATLLAGLAALPAGLSAPERWRRISKELLVPEHPFALHWLLYERNYQGWDHAAGPPPAWLPERRHLEESNLGRLIRRKGFAGYSELHAWSIARREEFWAEMVDRLGIRLARPCRRILEGGPEHPRWLPGAELNIAESCFKGDRERPAVLFYEEGGGRGVLTLGELDRLSNRVALGLAGRGVRPGDALAVDMPMTAESVALYLGILKAGAAAVSIADSFAPEEIATRLKIAGAKGIFTCDRILRGGKSLPLFERVAQAGAPPAVVLPAAGRLQCALRPADLGWNDFLPAASDFSPVRRSPEDVVNILFSSGTTGEPKAIPWTQTTPIKCAADGWLHHDLRPGHVAAWPTNLGWMMGPWLIFASLVNGAALALYYGSPNGRGFGEFVRDAGVTMLGVIPSLVKHWQATGCMAGLDWSGIELFSSTGEASSPRDMLFLMSRARYKPVIEYCGGTEIGGGFVTGTVVQPAAPSAFSTPALGLDFRILDEHGRETPNGELFLVPPSIGLSTRLLNRDHHEVYHAGVPAGPGGELLRRHGDQFERLGGGYCRTLGRVDDTMNMGGIKVSSAEIERTVGTLPGLKECAAVAVPPPGGGPSLLFLFVVPGPGEQNDPEALRLILQKRIAEHLNPLFKVQRVVVLDALPRTASNKVMRRVLRDRLEA